MGSARGLADHVEKWMSWVPGIGTYREREKRRETDKKIREHIADDLQEVRSHLKRTITDFSRKGNLDFLVDLDQLSTQIQQLMDTIRYASYGYAGIFALEKIREEEIHRLCSFDLSLKEDVENLRKKIGEITPTLSADDLKKKILEAGKVVVDLDEKYKSRKEFMGRNA